MGLFGGIAKIGKGLGGILKGVGPIAAGVGVGLDALQGLKNSKADRNTQNIQNQLGIDSLALNRDRFTQDTKNFNLNLDENQRQFDQRFGFERDRFGKEKETEQFGRARNARFAKVRAPLVGGLLAGRTIADDPQATARLAKLR